MQTPALVNGHLSSSLPVTDRAIQFGDGVFETIAVWENKICLWDLHIKRLSEGCQRLNINPPDPAVLQNEVEQLVGDNTKCVVKIIISRGYTGRGYAYDKNKPQSATRIISIHAYPKMALDQSNNGVRLYQCKTRLGSNPDLAGIKHLNRLEQVLARNEWNDQEYDEGLMLNLENEIIEATSSNLFILNNDQLMTPDLSKCGIAGTARQVIMNVAKNQDTPVIVKKIMMDDLICSDQAYITNSVLGIRPIFQFADKKWDYAPIPPILSLAQQNIFGN